MSFWEEVERKCRPKMRAKDPFELDPCVDELEAAELARGRCPHPKVDRLTYGELKCAFLPDKRRPERQLMCVNKALRKVDAALQDLRRNNALWWRDPREFERETGRPYGLEVQKMRRCLYDDGKPRVVHYRTEIPKFPGLVHFMGWDGPWEELPKREKVLLLDEAVNAAHQVGTLADFLVVGGRKTLDGLAGEGAF